MKVLLSGATGFLGGRVATLLAQAGHQVRGFVRDPARWADRPDGAEVALGDVTEADAYRAAAEGCDVVVHGDALVKPWAKDPSAFDRVNVGGLANAAEAARTSGARLLHVSSFFALGPTDGRIFDEDTPRASHVYHNDYERTKTLADQLARRLSAEGLPVVRLYPGVVYGPGNLTSGNHVGGLLLDHARGRLPGSLGKGDGLQCVAYVEDVAGGVVAAVERAEPGSAYILGGDNRTTVELFQAFQAATGIRPPRLRIPYKVAEVAGLFMRWGAELTGMEPILTDEVARIYRREWACSSQRAVDDLGYHVTSLEDGVAGTVAWLRGMGRL